MTEQLISVRNWLTVWVFSKNFGTHKQIFAYLKIVVKDLLFIHIKDNSRLYRIYPHRIQLSTIIKILKAVGVKKLV